MLALPLPHTPRPLGGNDVCWPASGFANRVYDACRRIPAGRVASYASLARAIGCGAPRAVGQALARNPFAPEVPCHRVIAADGTIGGFNRGRRPAELARKLRLLRAEGVTFGRDGRLADTTRWFRF